MADGDAREYGQGDLSETNRQSHAIGDWVGNPPGQSFPDGDNDTDDLGSYAPVSLPPHPGPRAADVAAERGIRPDVFGFPGVGGGNRRGGSGGMYG